MDFAIEILEIEKKNIETILKHAHLLRINRPARFFRIYRKAKPVYRHYFKNNLRYWLR